MFKGDAILHLRWQSKVQSKVMRLVSYGVLLSMLLTVTMACIAAQSGAMPPVSNYADASGMYSFEREGEFVQITIEQPAPKRDSAKPLAVSGFISRFADADSDRGAFLDYFISKGTVDGKKIAFTTRTVHGVFYEFKGTIARGAAATKDKDGYFEMRGTLTQNIVSQDKTVSPRSREITMKLFPDMDREPAK